MIEIPLVNSLFMATVDDSDYQLVSKCSWYLHDYKNGTLYAQTSTGLKMHCPGVKWNKTNQQWEVQITVMGKRKYLGSFHTLDVAIEKRKDAERKYRNKGEEKD